MCAVLAPEPPGGLVPYSRYRADANERIGHLGSVPVGAGPMYANRGAREPSSNTTSSVNSVTRRTFTAPACGADRDMYTTTSSRLAVLLESRARNRRR